MSANLQELLEEINDDLDRVKKELDGFRYELVVTRIRGKRDEYYQEIAPEKKPKNRKSDIIEDLIDSYYPGTPTRNSTAQRLLEVWKTDLSKEEYPLVNIKNTFILLQPILEALYPKMETMATSATSWRKPILEKYGRSSEEYKLSIYRLGISREESISMKVKYKENVRALVKSRGDRVKYTFQHILDVIDEAAASDHPILQIIAVLLTTGSRLIECIKVTSYELPRDEPGYMIKLSGIAKDRATSKGTTPKSIVKPVIRIAPRKVIELVQNIRATFNLSLVSNAQATAKVDRSVNKMLGDLFSEVDAKLPETKRTTAHKLRFIYAQIAYHLYGKPANIPENEFVREVLGHDSGEVSLTYQQILVDFGEVTIPSDYKVKLRELKHDTSELKKEQKEMKKDIIEVKSELNKSIDEAKKINVQFPEYVNSRRIRLSKEEKLNRLRQLDTALRNAGLPFSQKLAKKYGYGSTIIQDYWHTMTA